MNLSEKSSPEPAGPAERGLADRLRQRIKQEGPITFRAWMEAALYDPLDGYYCRPDIQRWGRAGDYRTSPERSPLFAATFARYFNSLYEVLGRPASWTIVEIGCGSGDFAKGVLETLSRYYPSAFSAVDYVIDELSANSSAAAAVRLAKFANRLRLACLDNFSAMAPAVVFANELLDAFPVHRVTLRDGKLREIYVALDQSGDFAWTIGALSDSRLAEYFEFVGVQLAEGQTAEINLGIEDWLTKVAGELRSGYLVTVDYGAEAGELYGAPERREGTLRAFRNHQLAADILAHPGAQDITATVDWTFVRKLGERLGFETVACTAQDKFLMSSGLLEELERMGADTEDEAQRLRLRTSAREMILPDGMAASFQVLVQKKMFAKS